MTNFSEETTGVSLLSPVTCGCELDRKDVSWGREGRQLLYYWSSSLSGMAFCPTGHLRYVKTRCLLSWALRVPRALHTGLQGRITAVRFHLGSLWCLCGTLPCSSHPGPLRGSLCN